MLKQPPYSTDLAPCDIFLFPKVIKVVKGICFQDLTAITTAVTKELQAIPEKPLQEVYGSVAAENEKVHPSSR